LTPLRSSRYNVILFGILSTITENFTCKTRETLKEQLCRTAERTG
jgi:hypothetical protein